MTEPETTPVVVGDVTYPCPECGKPFGRPFLLGAHRRREHGVEGQSKNAKSARRKTSGPRQDRHPVISGLRAAADDLGGTRAKTPPTAEQLAHAFGRGLFTVNTAIATAVVEGDDMLPTDELKEATLDYLTLSAHAAKEVMEPLGRAFAGTPLNRRYGRAIVTNVDVLGSLAELSMLGYHWRRYLRIREQARDLVQQQGGLPMQRRAAPPPPPPETAASNGHTAPPQEGRVWTKEDVDRMRGMRRG